MPQGDKSSYTSKQKRQAEHIEESYEEKGLSEKESKRRAWATVNKLTGGGLKKNKGESESGGGSSGKKGGSSRSKGGKKKKEQEEESTKGNTPASGQKGKRGRPSKKSGAGSDAGGARSGGVRKAKTAKSSSTSTSRASKTRG